MGGMAGRKFQERGDIRIHIANSLCCTAETNTKNFYSADLNKTAIQTDLRTCDLVFEHSQQSLPINFCLKVGAEVKASTGHDLSSFGITNILKEKSVYFLFYRADLHFS